MKSVDYAGSLATCIVAFALMAVGLINLGVRLKQVQIDEVARYAGEGVSQSTRKIRTDGRRGRIFDIRGRVLADNRNVLSIVCNAAVYQQGSYSNTVGSVLEKIQQLASIIGRAPTAAAEEIDQSIRRRSAVPVELWQDLSETELARFEERSREYPGFFVLEDDDRVYPYAPLARQLIGSVRKAPGEVSPSEHFYWATDELRGREGLECYYDAYLRGVPGEDRIRINSIGYTSERWTVEPVRPGVDLHLSIDIVLQREAEAQLEGLRGACVALDPRNGNVLAAASSAGYFLAFGGEYAPGSTFKPITALAALKVGIPSDLTYECDGAFVSEERKIRCTSRWGHGILDLRHALMKSCNPYFCYLGCDIGTNQLFAAASAFGLGRRTGVDYVLDRPGKLPSAEYKEACFHRAWNAADLAESAIGQGMLLVTPLQMVRVAGAIATGNLVRPRLNTSLPIERSRLPFAERDLNVVREGMRMVVAGDEDRHGTGWRGAMGVPVPVCGKTGTAEVGAGAARRKNTWFIAYAPMTNATIAVAMVVEHGESGGGTTAPKVAAVLRRYYEK